MILAGDIGGTKTNLAFFKAEGGQLKLVVEGTFPSRGHAGLDEIVSLFTSMHGLGVEQACFGVAGPVQNGRCDATNLAWVVDASQLARQLGIATVWLINDLEANAYGIPVLRPEEFVVLNPGAPDAGGNAVVIAAGTGLGEAGLYWDGKRHYPFACEGGHADFAPRNEFEVNLLLYLLAKYGHASWERVLSGPGLHNIYEFLRDTGQGEEPEWLIQEMAEGNPVSVISKAGLAGSCDLCGRALEMFASLYGAEAGNLALKIMATGGVYVGGGIAPKIVKKLTDGRFMKAFVDKGRFEGLMQRIPVRVILNDKTALLGAARYALLQAQGGDAK